MWVIGVGMLFTIGLFGAGWVIAAKHVTSKWDSLDRRQRRRCFTYLLAFAVMIVGIANAIVFFTVSVAIGGDADRVEGDRYYVSSHGRLTEVSRAVWIYSDNHRTVTWFTSILTAVAIAVIMSFAWLAERDRSSLRITVARDGSILIDDQSVTIEEVIARAERAKALREPIYLKHDYPPDAVPTGAVQLHHELIGHQILFQAVEHPVK